MKVFKFRSVKEYQYLAEDYEDAYMQHYHDQGKPIKEGLISSLPVSTVGEELNSEDNK